MAEHDRSWREWARRWGLRGTGSTGVMPLSDFVQPVVLLDDASALNTPPVRRQYGLGQGVAVTAVAVQEDGISITPRALPILICWIQVTTTSGVLIYGVNDEKFVPDGAGIFDTPIPARISGWREDPPIIGPAPAINTCDATVETWHTLTLPDQQGTEPSLASGVLKEVEIWVYPGQSFWLRTTGINCTMTINDIRWWEFPTLGENQLTSMPKNRG